MIDQNVFFSDGSKKSFSDGPEKSLDNGQKKVPF